jgi:hypothetical protein
VDGPNTKHISQYSHPMPSTVLYRRLVADFVWDARALRIDCLECNYGVEDGAEMICIGANRLPCSFFDYVGKTRLKGLLSKVSVDGCHPLGEPS